MTTSPEIPPLVLIPGDPKSDYSVLYATATAYAHSGLLISAHGHKSNCPEFSFPAVVCSSFAIELFLKFFLSLQRTESETPQLKRDTGHDIGALWEKIHPTHQALVAGMFLNSTGVPVLNAPGRRIERFVEALSEAGKSPFLEWRYVHELAGLTIMSHAVICEVVDALGYAANYAVAGRSERMQGDASASGKAVIAPDRSVGLDQPDGDGLSHGPVSENLLLPHDSILRRIPVNVDPKQAFFLDGIRHAVEIMDVAYIRLRAALTHLALSPPLGNELPDASARAFLDAWSFVDAVNRFFMMYTQMPGMKLGTTKVGVPPLREVLQNFRDLRNVADDLAQQSDYVLSQNGTALGELNWLTGAQLEPDVVAWHCTLRPGTFQSIPPAKTDPIVTTLDLPTDCIRLTVGGYEGDLSDARKHISVRISHLEAQLQHIFQQPDQKHVPVIVDIFARRSVKLVKPVNP